ncbi:MAG: aspartate-semialdehyde dehydrogenase [Nitrososphaerota archaeon]|jgi:aspartate-semialdehyde dehydrogenase|nr:aspartate-semialdehyde dehydrogenase [Nitrososphaerota archaeon]MDG6943199.1 aspartate-semialdehyde dehydrogenase [Nitrososphaerota archaeon]MDG6950923.1 aspartate-semialdehyde dehydrogenase [Nitrososphaerota archaeon]
MTKLRAALLGSTGAVGQRYLSMLNRHPTIELGVLMGGNSAGKAYGEAAHWLAPEDIPEQFASMDILPTDPRGAQGCDVVFSALPAEAASVVEPEFAKAGLTVISEASAHRLEDDVPLMIPEVNPDHLGVLYSQKKKRGWSGSMVTTPNCTVTGLAMVLKPLSDKFALRRAVVTTMQAISGAGFPGVPSLLITENVVPYIRGEEEKVADESRKILGTREDGGIRGADLQIAISCNRVPVLEGHVETLYAELGEDLEPEDAIECLNGFRGAPQELGLPSAPGQPIIVRREPDRPQPRLDRLAGSVPGMSVVVGRVRRGLGRDSIQLTLLSHNTIRGAAGTAILTAELMHSRRELGS